MDKINFIKNIPQYPQKSPEWINQRKGKLTSSDSATALDINPYQKQFDLLLKKCGFYPDFEGSEATFHGEKYETEAIEKYEKLLNKTNFEFGLISYNDINPIRQTSYNFNYDLNFLAGSPDGIAIDNHTNELIMLEVKCPISRKIKYGYCPNYYMSQIQLNMFILDIQKSDYIEYLPDNHPNGPCMNIVRIYRNEKWIQENIPKLINFWESVLFWKKQHISLHPNFSFKALKRIKYNISEETFNSLYPTIQNNKNNNNNHNNNNNNDDSFINDSNLFIDETFVSIDFIT